MSKYVFLLEWEKVRYNSLHACGRRQVVRPKLPKLVFAGSSPVARSMNFPTLPSGGVFFLTRIRFGARMAALWR